MEDLIENINKKMNERNYLWHSITGNNKVLHYITPLGEKPNIACDVFIKENNNVEFKFKFLTKKGVILTTDNIGCFFDDKHFHKFEIDFWVLAKALYNFENIGWEDINND